MLRGREYPPVAPDANEHMAEVPGEPGVLGAGTWLSGARGRRGTLGPGPGNERAHARSREGVGGTSRASRHARARARGGLGSASGPEMAALVTWTGGRGGSPGWAGLRPEIRLSRRSVDAVRPESAR